MGKIADILRARFGITTDKAVEAKHHELARESSRAMNEYKATHPNATQNELDSYLDTLADQHAKKFNEWLGK